MLDVGEVVRRAVKYLVEGAAVALAAYYIPQGRRLKLEEVAMIALTAAATFAVLDLLAPSMAGSVRTGAGLAVGMNMGGLETTGGVMA